MTTASACAELASPWIATTAVATSEGYAPGESAGAQPAAGSRPSPVDSQADWDFEWSFRRIYASLAKVLGPRQLRRLLVGFFADVGRPELSEGLIPHEYYERLFVAVTMADRGPQAWAVYVKHIYPIPPKGFDGIGKMGNSPANPSPGAVPRSEHIHKTPPGFYESSSGDD